MNQNVTVFLHTKIAQWKPAPTLAGNERSRNRWPRERLICQVIETGERKKKVSPRLAISVHLNDVKVVTGVQQKGGKTVRTINGYT